MRHARILALLSLLLVAALFSAPAHAATDLLIRLPIGSTSPEVNGAAVTIDVPAQIRDGRTLVPLRFVSENMGAGVQYQDAEKRITLTLGQKRVVLWVGQTRAEINGSPATLDVPPVIVDSRTLVPLRFISENLGAEVAWDGQAKEAFVVMGSPANLVRIRNFTFQPEHLFVKAGSRVVVMNQDGAAHTWSDAGGRFTTGSLSRGSATTLVLKDSGVYDIVCRFHPAMRAMVHVEP